MYKITIALILSLNLLALDAQDNNNSDINFKILPIVSSNPNSGTSGGFMTSLIYKVDKNSSPSQAIVTAQYSNTDSYHFFAINKMYFNSDKFISNTILGYIFNNSEFDIDIPQTPVGPIEGGAEFDVTIKVVGQQLLYELYTHFYVGGLAYYLEQDFSAKNDLGKAFLASSGVTNSKRGGIGAILEYDSRSKKEKFYPRNAEYITYNFNYAPELLGSEKTFYTTNLNTRVYRPGFKNDDVVAMQVYLTYASENTPDGALAALGARNILRGFSIGQYKARNMAAAQIEYRYEITGTRFKLATFAGAANLNGGSNGTLIGNRDNNNGNYYSGGVGARYTIQKKAGVDYRIDLAATNTDEYSLYATINQAF